jgi:hypothetical protein
MSDLETILSMLSYRRPAKSPGEAAFIEKFIMPLGVAKDQFGNLFKIIGDEAPSVLWSSHTDSVHSQDGFQKVAFDGNKFIKLPAKSISNCLGADCAAGVWIMTEMIKARVPGLYVFHFAEEIGCVGSRAIANDNPKFLDGIKAAIAFDRRGNNSVITHQGSRGCSDAFGDSMIEQLPSRFKLDPTGFVTDTKMYMKLVPECTNISVGYYHEHSPEEKLDVGHLIELRDHMVKIDTSKLVISRDPNAVVPLKPKKYGSFGSFRSLLPRNIEDLVWTYPRLVAQFLEDSGISFDELDQYIQSGGLSSIFGDIDDEDEDENGDRLIA